MADLRKLSRSKARLRRRLTTKTKEAMSDQELFTSRQFSSELEKIAAAQASRYRYGSRISVDVRWNSKSSTVAYTDNQRIVINADCDLLHHAASRSERYELIFGLFTHELGHILYTDFDAVSSHISAICRDTVWYPEAPSPSAGRDAFLKWTQENKEYRHLIGDVIRLLHNLFEDGHIENLLLENYPGRFKRCLERVRHTHMSEMPTVSAMLSDENYQDFQIAEQVALCYAKYGYIPYGSAKKNEPLLRKFYPLLDSIDDAVNIYSADARCRAVNEFIAAYWAELKDYLDRMIEQYQQAEKTFSELLSESQEKIAGSSAAAIGKGLMVKEKDMSGKAKSGSESSPSARSRTAIRMKKKIAAAESEESEEVESSPSPAKVSSETPKTESARSESEPPEAESDFSASEETESEREMELSEASEESPAAETGSEEASETSAGLPEDELDESDEPETESGLPAADSGESEPEEAEDSSAGADESKDSSESEEYSETETEDYDESDGLGSGSDSGSELPEDLAADSESSDEPETDSSVSSTPGFMSDSDSDGSATPEKDYRREPDEGVAEAVEGDGEITYDADYEPEPYEDAANDIERILESMVEESVAEKMDSVVQKELQAQSDGIDYGNLHAGVPISIRRQSSVNASVISQYKQIAPPLLSISKALQRNFSKQIKDRQIGTKMSGLVYGRRIEGHSLYRTDNKVFSKRSLPNDQPVLAVSLLIDESGSMGWGDRITYARAAGIIMQDFCAGLEIPFACHGHRTDGRTCVIDSYSEFDSEDSNDRYRIMSVMARGNNRDGAALRFAAEQISHRPEATKLLILISDGEPADYGYEGKAAEEELRQIHAEMRRKGIVLVAAAIGDDRDAIRRIYGDSYMDISDLRKLPVTLTQVVARHIKV